MTELFTRTGVASGMDKRQHDFYQRWRGRVREWALSHSGRSHRWSEYILMAPDVFHLLCRLAADPAVAPGEKAKAAAMAAYFIMPFDFLPEAITGPIGLADDVALAAWVLHGILTKTPPDVLRRHWAGEEDILITVERLLRFAQSAFGKSLWARRMFWSKRN